MSNIKIGSSIDEYQRFKYCSCQESFTDVQEQEGRGHKLSRKRLFTMITDLPTIFDVVTGMGKTPASNHSSNKSRLKMKVMLLLNS
ncbi:PHD finger protein ALFIN-LIKE 3-like isoform X2 [Arachis ipaensis]|uniref:PHD finger protein ALFIN-LIKE 3-like isoform X2 n=1 Tax=Arachis ipaensis TaxID=130454 RepID=UPI000A2B8C8F|nr:PHD finger protein ALFIN-LIKE 3-like isoform X2 [Arachis ipaensis]